MDLAESVCYACGKHTADSHIEYYISSDDGGREYHPECFARLICMALSLQNKDNPLDATLIQVAGRLTLYDSDQEKLDGE